MGNYHQKRVRVNYHYFMVMQNDKYPIMDVRIPVITAVHHIVLYQVLYIQVAYMEW